MKTPSWKATGEWMRRGPSSSDERKVEPASHFYRSSDTLFTSGAPLETEDWQKRGTIGDLTMMMREGKHRNQDIDISERGFRAYLSSIIILRMTYDKTKRKRAKKSPVLHFFQENAEMPSLMGWFGKQIKYNIKKGNTFVIKVLKSYMHEKEGVSEEEQILRKRIIGDLLLPYRKVLADRIRKVLTNPEDGKLREDLAERIREVLSSPDDDKLKIEISEHIRKLGKSLPSVLTDTFSPK